MKASYALMGSAQAMLMTMVIAITNNSSTHQGVSPQLNVNHPPSHHRQVVQQQNMVDIGLINFSLLYDIVRTILQNQMETA
ncbi:hypothetical protein KIN20_025753 [Parelaphostrongylus tenuis]|uniref:Uncharacterized protein n=1 Tax=Parelaphostrongylus tenuis TaxID=148309 RepID=A0AAD5MYU2_PARTN|nr:hypothetical protein KIN20_025753 [Parelaphostrongylus tenuis]